MSSVQRQARQRTESMAQRLAKKPLSEGFELWDKGYVLGAMRLFTFKAENSPPFHLGPILDAMAHLLREIGEANDAKENFVFAQEKYELIQQPIVAQLMFLKSREAVETPEAVIPALDEFIASIDADRSAASKEAKVKSAVARVYHFRAQLLLELGRVQDALADAQYAASLGWDRVHLAFYLVGVLFQHLGDQAEAERAYDAAIAANPLFIAGYEALLPLAQGNAQKSLNLVSRAIEIHPRAEFIRQKAFLLSEEGCDVEALTMLDAAVANPPHEETEAVMVPGANVAIFQKAKAAILADLGRLEEALAAAKSAAEIVPGDEEAERMRQSIAELLAAPA